MGTQHRSASESSCPAVPPPDAVWSLWVVLLVPVLPLAGAALVSGAWLLGGGL